MATHVVVTMGVAEVNADVDDAAEVEVEGGGLVMASLEDVTRTVEKDVAVVQVKLSVMMVAVVESVSVDSVGVAVWV